MRDIRLAVGGGFLLALGALALLAPLLGLRDPRAQPDGLVLRELPPLARVEALRLADGRTLYAHELRHEERTGTVSYRRGTRWTSLAPSELQQPRWHERQLFLLGTDALGRDLLSRLLHGARVSLLVGLVAAAMAVLGGSAVGLLAGLLGRSADALLMRLTDLVLAIPRLFLALMLVALWGASLLTTVVVLAATTWMAAARLVRGEVLAARERGFVEAARAGGAGPLRLGLLHLLPAALVPLSVEGALRVGDTILLEAALSFLGLGIPPPAPSWGSLIADGRHSLLHAWWISTLPGLAIAATVIALNLLGDALRDRWAGLPSGRIPGWSGSSTTSRAS
jgi:ABC-type dipeptide/oligopeptide/nickel transport system permease subunit